MRLWSPSVVDGSDESRQTEAIPSPPSTLLMTVAAGLIGLGLCWATLTAHSDYIAERPALDALSPLVQQIIRLGGCFNPHYRAFLLALGVAGVVLCALCVVAAARRLPSAVGAAYLFGATGLLVTAQCLLLFEHRLAAGVLYGAAGIAFVLASRARPSVLSAFRETPTGPAGRRFAARDLVLVCCVTAMAILLRFYALDRVLSSFEGELAGFMAGASDLRGLAQANIGRDGNWAPLGFLYFAPILATSKALGVNYLSVRLASALVSTMTVPLVYGLVRSFSNTNAALLASLLVAISPLQIGWGRTDVHPHGSTVWITLLIVWALYHFATTGSRSSVWLVIGLMGLSWHQYPSGQSATLIPLGLVCWVATGALSIEGTRLDRTRLVLFGLPFWLANTGLPDLVAEGRWRLPPVATMFGQRTSWAISTSDSLAGASVELLVRWVENATALVEGVVVRVPHLTHQTFLPQFDGIPVTTVDSLAAALAALGLLVILRERHRAAAALLALWIVSGALPSILSSEGVPKRAATIYPALLILAALGIVTILRAGRSLWGRRFSVLCWSWVGLWLVLQSSSLAHYWFSGEHYTGGRPESVVTAREIGSLLQPGDLLVLDMWEGNMAMKLTFHLLDDLASSRLKPVAVYFADADTSMETLLDDPGSLVDTLDRQYYYLWTHLYDDLPDLVSLGTWNRVLLVSQTSSPDVVHLEVKARHEKAALLCPSSQRFVVPDGSVGYPLQVLECRLRESSGNSDDPASAAP